MNSLIIEKEGIQDFMDTVGNHLNKDDVIVVSENKSINLDLSAKMTAFLNKAKELDFLRRTI